ncbi:hypothetical protein HDZ31DRAFT_60211 [Schizophyllum fasciatum]
MAPSSPYHKSYVRLEDDPRNTPIEDEREPDAWRNLFSPVKPKRCIKNMAQVMTVADYLALRRFQNRSRKPECLSDSEGDATDSTFVGEGDPPSSAAPSTDRQRDSGSDTEHSVGDDGHSGKKVERNEPGTHPDHGHSSSATRDDDDWDKRSYVSMEDGTHAFDADARSHHRAEDTEEDTGHIPLDDEGSGNDDDDDGSHRMHANIDVPEDLESDVEEYGNDLED